MAIATLAYISAAIAHEVFGHGVAFYLAGGRQGIFTTTRLITDQQIGRFGGRVFDLGGPVGNLLVALVAWTLLRVLGKAGPALRLFLILSTGFNLLWTTGYMLFSGVLGRGDWMALAFRPYLEWPVRLALVAGGFLAYRETIRLIASELHWLGEPSAENVARLKQLLWWSYLAGGIAGTLGPLLDPRGAMEMLNSGALSSFAAALGFLRTIPLYRVSAAVEHGNAEPVRFDLAWVCAAGAALLYFVGILGPGVKFSWW